MVWIAEMAYGLPSMLHDSLHGMRGWHAVVQAGYAQTYKPKIGLDF